MTRVVRMNESTSRNFDDIPLPARQQLGYFDETVDVDARSGNGVDKLREDSADNMGRDYGVIPATRGGGSRVREVTYHLDTTPAPEEPYGAPGSKEYNESQGRSNSGGPVLESRNNATTARQSEDQYATTQRAGTGRNERMMAAVGNENTASVHADEDGAARVRPSGAARLTVQGTLNEVGDDKDKARDYLERERNSENQRSSLISKLEDIINDDSDDEDANEDDK